MALSTKTEIRIVVETAPNTPATYQLSRWKNGKCKETYRHESLEVMNVWMIAILNGFRPPPILKSLDEL